MGNLNEDLGRLRTGKSVGTCQRCKTEMPNGELNYEATIHHGAKKVICIDRQQCERRRRRVA
jgi:hypothetical protein